jgi:hypothetical protein
MLLKAIAVANIRIDNVHDIMRERYLTSTAHTDGISNRNSGPAADSPTNSTQDLGIFNIGGNDGDDENWLTPNSENNSTATKLLIDKYVSIASWDFFRRTEYCLLLVEVTM